MSGDAFAKSTDLEIEMIRLVTSSVAAIALLGTALSAATPASAQSFGDLGGYAGSQGGGIGSALIGGVLSYALGSLAGGQQTNQPINQQTYYNAPGPGYGQAPPGYGNAPPAYGYQNGYANQGYGNGYQGGYAQQPVYQNAYGQQSYYGGDGH